MESLRSPQSARTPTLSDVPEEDGAFAIGDDEDEDFDGEDQIMRPTPSPSSPYTHHSPSPSVASSVDDAAPLQLRGMSEKARGKMPAGQVSFSRVNSTTSLSSQTAALMSANPGFTPSAYWVSISSSAIASPKLQHMFCDTD